jgi:hypothetical protein
MLGRLSRNIRPGNHCDTATTISPRGRAAITAVIRASAWDSTRRDGIIVAFRFAKVMTLPGIDVQWLPEQLKNVEF